MATNGRKKNAARHGDSAVLEPKRQKMPNSNPSMRRYENKVAIVTGAASGIGLAAAKRLGQEGARLTLVDLQETPLKEAAAITTQAGGGGGGGNIWGGLCGRE